MFTIVLLSAFLLCSNADPVGFCNSSVQYSVRCSERPRARAPDEPEVTVRAAGPGSYDVEYCGSAANKPTTWFLGVKYHANVPENKCHSSIHGFKGSQWPEHSKNELKLDYDLNCTYDVCFKQRLDLMFQGCYRFENRLKGLSSKPLNSYHYIDNNITNKEYYYLEQKPIVHNIQHDTFLSFAWYTGVLPLTHYSIGVCKRINETHLKDCQNACHNCTRVYLEGKTQLSCRLALSPLCYRLQLTHYEPWTNSILFDELKNTYGEACPERKQSAPLSPSDGRMRAWWWWWGGAALVVCAGALAALLAKHSRLADKLRERVRDVWLTRRMSEYSSGPRKEQEESAPLRILLLYARDAAAERVVATLRTALEIIAPGQVYDIFSPAVTSLAGGAAHAWAGAALRDMRVVLLQLPALRLLHDQQLAGGSPRLREPLLARSVRRAPVFGDTLLQYALRGLADTHATHPDPYRHYYLATLSELPEDLFPYVTPFRRYELPAATEVLLRDLADLTDPADRADRTDASALVPERLAHEMATAARDLAMFVEANSNYMDDELIMLD